MGVPTAVFFGTREELHERPEARLVSSAEPEGWARVALSLNRTMLVPPFGSALNLEMLFDNERTGISYRSVEASAIDRKALAALGDLELSAAVAADGTCAPELRVLSNI